MHWKGRHTLSSLNPLQHPPCPGDACFRGAVGRVLIGLPRVTGGRAPSFDEGVDPTAVGTSLAFGRELSSVLSARPRWGGGLPIPRTGVGPRPPPRPACRLARKEGRFLSPAAGRAFTVTDFVCGPDSLLVRRVPGPLRHLPFPPAVGSVGKRFRSGHRRPRQRPTVARLLVLHRGDGGRGVGLGVRVSTNKWDV